MVSRRRFIKLTAAAAAGLTLGSRLGAAEQLLAQEDVEKYIGAPVTITDLTYNPDEVAIGT